MRTLTLTTIYDPEDDVTDANVYMLLIPPPGHEQVCTVTSHTWKGAMAEMAREMRMEYPHLIPCLPAHWREKLGFDKW